jgi:hypothetical protein
VNDTLDRKLTFSGGRKLRFLVPAVALLVPFMLSGCAGESGPQMYPVQGTVSFDGTPVENGRILFRRVDGDQRGFSGEITNGRYELNAEPGSMTVEITASRIIPGEFDTSNDEPEPKGEMYIPAKYNAETELTAEVKASGDNNIPFDLKSDD